MCSAIAGTFLIMLQFMNDLSPMYTTDGGIVKEFETVHEGVIRYQVDVLVYSYALERFAS